ncbi:MAG: ThuA domain-containing protein [Chthonomonadales bacterium]|nr:ThuA domain-containing protein [Chthonomonadales bacterium]
MADAERPIRTAVLTGWHPFDVPAFQDLLESMPGIRAYPQDLTNWAFDADGARERYDVHLFYNMHPTLPPDDWPGGAQARPALEALERSRGGIVLLHHAILAWPDWPYWGQLAGIGDRRFGYHMAQRFRVRIADPEHPITRGLADFDLADETYTMAEAGPDCHVVLATDHPLSMRTLAWTRRQGEARVFCLQPGHDADAWRNPMFRTVLARGIRWAARAL